MKASFIASCLRKRHSFPPYSSFGEWLFATEVYTTIGHYKQNRIDAFAMNCWRCKNYKRIAYEIKVSKADFLSEIAKPKKRVGAMCLSNEFYFVIPKGLMVVDYNLIPDCGVMEVDDNGGIKITHVAIKRDVAYPPLSFITVFARKVRDEYLETYQKEQYEKRR